MKLRVIDPGTEARAKSLDEFFQEAEARATQEAREILANLFTERARIREQQEAVGEASLAAWKARQAELEKERRALSALRESKTRVAGLYFQQHLPDIAEEMQARYKSGWKLRDVFWFLENPPSASELSHILRLMFDCER